ncbi:MAG: hypothetical protein HYS74_00615 [Parcubacteria group bacterium]|nr:hypothetical protein [Parcubacteria group bacterium]
MNVPDPLVFFWQSVAFSSETLARLFADTFAYTPFWLPPVLLLIFWTLWVPYKRARFLAGQKITLLEIKVPREQMKSPLAMEVVLNALHQTVGESNWYDRYVLGKTRAYFSLELVSLEGAIHFFVWTRAAVAKFIETQVYSQYPDAEVHEVSDYTALVPYARKGSDWNLYAAEFTLTKQSPFPLKTYVDYNLDRDPKEELKVDPLTPMLEFMGGVGRGEQVWFQIIVRANKGKKDPTPIFGVNEDWQDQGKEIINEIFEKSKERSGAAPGMEGSDFRFAMMTEGERNTIKAIERKIGKLGYDCGIRAIYLAKKDAFNGANIAGMFGVMKAYSTNDLNGFRPRDYTDIDFPWQHYINIPPQGPGIGAPFFSPSGARVAYKKWILFDGYRKRSWFFPPYERKAYVLNTEELATLYHFPGRVAETPTFERIESRRGEPPTNLPV